MLDDCFITDVNFYLALQKRSVTAPAMVPLKNKYGTNDCPPCAIKNKILEDAD